MQMICILYYNDSYSYVNEYANDLHIIKKEAINEGTEKVPFFVRFYTLIVGNMV